MRNSENISHIALGIMRSVVNKNKNEYRYNIFLAKGSYKEKSNTRYF